jgi:hypothetical protein
MYSLWVARGAVNHGPENKRSANEEDTEVLEWAGATSQAAAPFKRYYNTKSKELTMSKMTLARVPLYSKASGLEDLNNLSHKE